MGIDVAHDVYRQQRRRNRAEVRIAKAQKLEIGKRTVRIALLGRALAGKNASPERKQAFGEYADARIVSRQRALGITSMQARYEIEDINRWMPEAFEADAMNLSNYRHRLTEGEGAISAKTFRHALNANPRQVLHDSFNWAETYPVHKEKQILPTWHTPQS